MASSFPLIEIEKLGVVAPRGFRTAAISCGIKDPTASRLDMALIHSAEPTVAAATFTTNRVKAAPVRLSQKHLAHGRIQAVIVNSGNANACNGEPGKAAALSMATQTAEALELEPSQVFICSTGVIGTPMPMERIEPKIGPLARSLQAEEGLSAAEAIMTSDTRPKMRAVEFEIQGKPVRIGAMTKGAGMINPTMATMLCFVTTDAAISREALQTATSEAVSESFNCISVDGDMSTNDTVLVMANGEAKNPAITEGSADATLFGEALEEVLLSLAKMMVKDGERVTKFVEVEIEGARSKEEARLAGKAVANSLLVKSAWNGGRAYWGRIMDAIGYSGAEFDDEAVAIFYNDLQAVENSCATGTPAEALHAITETDEFRIRIDLKAGPVSHTIYTSDVSTGFIEYNQVE
ncbi:MAG: bifunctional glutamate N-acetyltransferase/amino-acid acetyltransferase ArgJ [Verrucomicrobiota bacterium]